MFKAIRTVIYKVNDLEKAKEFYSSILGFPPYFDEPFYVGFNVNDFELGLDPDKEGVVYGNIPVAYWQVENIEKAKSNILEKGGFLHQEVQEVGVDIKVAELKDPFGNVIGIIEDKSFKK
ncbi:MAG: glyoxalase superfamily protein [Pelobium sp.]